MKSLPSSTIDVFYLFYIFFENHLPLLRGKREKSYSTYIIRGKYKIEEGKGEEVSRSHEGSYRF